MCTCTWRGLEVAPAASNIESKQFSLVWPYIFVCKELGCAKAFVAKLTFVVPEVQYLPSSALA